MLDRLATIRDVTRSQALLQVLLKLLGLCVKVKRNQEELIAPKLNTVSKLLSILQMCLSSDNEVAANVLMDQILEVLRMKFEIYVRFLAFDDYNICECVNFCVDFRDNFIKSIVRISKQLRNVFGGVWSKR